MLGLIKGQKQTKKRDFQVDKVRKGWLFPVMNWSQWVEDKENFKGLDLLQDWNLVTSSGEEAQEGQGLAAVSPKFTFSTVVTRGNSLWVVSSSPNLVSSRQCQCLCSGPENSIRFSSPWHLLPEHSAALQAGMKLSRTQEFSTSHSVWKIKILLLIDNVHGHPRSLTEMDNKVDVVFIPINTTFICSPWIILNF